MSPVTTRGARPKPVDERMRSKAIVLLTDGEFARLRELSEELNRPVSQILRDLLSEKYPKIFKEK